MEILGNGPFWGYISDSSQNFEEGAQMYSKL